MWEQPFGVAGAAADNFVFPAKAGIQERLVSILIQLLGSGFRRSDGTFQEIRCDCPEANLHRQAQRQRVLLGVAFARHIPTFI
jgi:hypothetical protein